MKSLLAKIGAGLKKTQKHWHSRFGGARIRYLSEFWALCGFNGNGFNGNFHSFESFIGYSELFIYLPGGSGCCSPFCFLTYLLSSSSGCLDCQFDGYQDCSVLPDRLIC